MEELIPLNIYKPPFNKIPEGEGFGFEGVILKTPDGSKIQCHICGELFELLCIHIRQHGMNVTEYRQKFQLARLTKLISPMRSEERSKAYISRYSDEEMKAMREKGQKAAKGKMNGKGVPLSLETKNKRGSCPDQIIEKIKQLALELGHTPTQLEFNRQEYGERFLHLIKDTFGTYRNALKVAELTPKIRDAYTKPKRSVEELQSYVTCFYEKEGRVPRFSDFGNGFLPFYSVYKRYFKDIEDMRSHLNLTK